MAWLLRTTAVLMMGFLVSSASCAQSTDQVTLTDTARFLAGMPPSPQSPLAPLTKDRGWQQHAQTLDTIWAALDANQLSKIRTWSQINLPGPKPVTYYPFSGPDFLYADAFFPSSSTYVMAGLELTGALPDVLKLKQRSTAGELSKLRVSLGNLLRTSYFITSEMGTDLSASQLRGTLPLLYVFLARTGKTIHEVSFIDLAADGSVQPAADAKSGARGVKIVFSGADAKPRTVYYFRTDLSNRGVENSGFLPFCAQLGMGDIFIKAASYLLHNASFSTLRDFLLSRGASVVQDDTGIPVTYFQKAGWDLRPYGRYVGPIHVFKGHYQSKLKDLFAKGDAAPIDFGIGYRWRLNQSHVLLAVNKNPSSAPLNWPASRSRKAAALGL